ncbi:MAG: DUF2625 family protein [Kibdelosporangium sp.]
MKSLDELIEVDEPVWPLVQQDFANSTTALRVLPASPAGRSCLLQLQVSVRSPLGAMALHTEGLVLDGGWLRVYGGSGLAKVNEFPAEVDPAWQPPRGLIVGHDAVGGVFALNGYDPAAVGRPGKQGQMIYFAPDTLEWEPMEIGGYGSWLQWLLSGALDEFYEGLRWRGWQAEAAALTPTQGIAVYPFLWSEEAHADLEATTRSAVPMAELLGLHTDFCAQLGLAAPGFLGSVTP